MAGNYTNAYASTEGSRFSLADTIVQQEQLNNQLTEQKRREKLLDEQRKDKLFERDEKLRERLLKIPQNFDTGVSSLNELQGRAIQLAVNRKGEIYNLLRNGKVTDSERIKLEIENQTLDNLPANLKVAASNIMKEDKWYTDSLEKGEIFRDVDFEKRRLNGFDNYLVGLDESGNPLVGYRDVDGDGKIDLVSWDKLKDGQSTWGFNKRISLDKLVDDRSKTLGTEETKTVNGYTEKTTKGLPLSIAQNEAKALIYDIDGNYKDVVKSYMIENGMDYKNPTPEAVKQIELYATDRFLNSKDRKDFTEKNFAAENSAADRAQRAQFHREDKVKDEKTVFGEAVKPTETKWGNHYKTLDPNALSVPISGKVNLDAITVKNSKGKVITHSNVNISAYSYNKDGKMVVYGSYPEGKTTKSLSPGDYMSDDKTTVTTNREFKSTVSKETEAQIANQAKSSIGELRQRANYTAKNMSDLPNINDLPNY